MRTEPPSSYLEGDIFQAEPESEPKAKAILDFIGPAEHILMSTSSQFPYRMAKLSDAGGDSTKRWRIDFYVWDTRKNDLVRKQKWIPSKFKTKAQKTAEANRLIRSINQILAEGYHLGEPIHKPEPKKTFWTWIQAFDWVYEHREPGIRKRSQQTLELVRKELKVWLELNRLSNLPLTHVTLDHCDEFMRWMRVRRKIGNTTYNNYLGFLKLNFNYLIQHDKLDRSPAVRLKPLPLIEAESVNFPTEIKNTLLEHYESNIRILAQYIYYSFIRPGELRKLRVKHLREKTIFIPGYISKNRKSGHVLIPPALEKLIVELGVRNAPPEHFLISHDGKPGKKGTSPNFYTSRHLALRRKLDLSPAYIFYCWKHTGVTDTYLATKDIEFVSRQCRHSSLDMTKRYLRGLGLLTEYPGQEQLPDLGL